MQQIANPAQGARADSALFLGWAYAHAGFVERAIAECKRAIERLALDSVQAAG